MARNVYHELNLHITWHTKANQAILTPEIEARLYPYLKHRILESAGVFFYAIGGVEDHIHIAVSIPPTLLISEWVGRMKGASSHYINYEIVNRKVLEWQNGYGVVSFGTKDLPWVKSYIENQKEHHAQNQLQTRLERTEIDS